MGKKLFLIVAAIALLAAGAIAGIKFAGDNRATVIGDASRYSAQAAGGALTRSVGGSGTGAVHEVRDGDSIQAAVAAAGEGDIIRVFPGTYSETVYIDKDDLVISGVVIEGAWPVMDGNKELNDAILYSGNDITVENLQIRHYKGNAIMGQAGNNFLIRNNQVIDTGIYGIFPEFGKNGLITHNVLSGIEDAAIYVGMCDNIHVTNNEVFDNVAGIEYVARSVARLHRNLDTRVLVVDDTRTFREYASALLGQRGATVHDPGFYRSMIHDWQLDV